MTGHAAAGTARELRAEELRAVSSIEEMHFEDTRQVSPLQRTVGQDRAMRAMEVGLGIAAPGFNIFISSRSGTGRTSIVRTLVEKVAAGKPVPPIGSTYTTSPTRTARTPSPCLQGKAFSSREPWKGWSTPPQWNCTSCSSPPSIWSNAAG